MYANMSYLCTNDASSLSIAYLKQIACTEKKRFAKLTFTQVALPILDDLFAKKVKYGQFDPPLSYRTNAKRIREWRWMGKTQQLMIIEKQEAMQEDTSIAASKIVTAAPQHMTPAKLRYSKRMAKESPEDDHKPLTKRISASSPVHSSRSNTPRTVSTTPPYLEELKRCLLPEDSDEPLCFTDTPPTACSSSIGVIALQCPVPQKANLSCQGISRHYIKKHGRTAVDTAEKGFCHLVGAAYHDHGSALSQKQVWPYDPQVYCGALHSNINHTLQWLLQMKTSSATSCVDTPDNYVFRSADCMLSEVSINGICNPCFDASKYFFRKCRDSGNLHHVENKLNSNTRNAVLTSPTLLKNKIKNGVRVRKTLFQQKYRIEIQKRLHWHLEEDGIELDSPSSVFQHCASSPCLQSNSG
jgi:hypothetical protein